MEDVKIAETRNVTIDNYSIEERFMDGKYNATSLLRQYNDRLGVNKTMSAYVRNLSAKDCENDMSVVKLKSAHGRSLNEVWFKPLAFTKFVSWLMGDAGDNIVSDIIVREKLMYESNEMHKRFMELLEEKNKTDWSDSIINKGRVEDGLTCIIFGSSIIGVESFATNDELLEKYALNAQFDFIVRNGLIKDADELFALIVKLYKGKQNKS